MFYINKYIFNDICDKNIDTYNEFILCIRQEYINIIEILKNVITVNELRFQIHKLVTIISNLHANELMYICKLLLLIDKNDANIQIETYYPYIQQIINYDNSKIGL
jgi:hypothetical protein